MGLSIAVVGGGIGGLFAANAFSPGFDVAVYEQAPRWGEVGAGVFLTPNSVRQLKRVGLLPAVEKYGTRVSTGRIISAMTAHRLPRAGHGRRRLERDLRHASRRCRRTVGRCAAQRRGATGHRATGFEQAARRPASHLPTAPRPKPTSSSRPTASTPRSGNSSSHRRALCSTARWPIAACCPCARFRTGPPIAG